jgi:hypothetical protein
MTQQPGPSSSPPAKTKPTIILDSGAYSAWRLGKPIDLEKYCDWLEANIDWIGPYVALDVIGPNDSEAAAKASYTNLVRMQQRGLKPIPVWHAGEDVKWLYKMLDLGCDYIGLSASSLVTKHNVDDWYAYAWSHLVNADGLPTIKAHAFGEGRLSSLKRFPWYSADSTSWIYASQRNGQVNIEGNRRVAMRNDGLSERASPDVNLLPEMDKAVFNQLLHELRIKPEVFNAPSKESTVLRTYMAAAYFLKIQEAVRAIQPIRFHGQGFFAGGSNAKAIDVGQFKFHLVIGNNPSAYCALAWAKHPFMLISYFYVVNSHMNTAASHHRALEAFSKDPIQTCIENPGLAAYWKTLQEYTYA